MTCHYVTVPAKFVTFKVYFEGDVDENDALSTFMSNIDELESEFIDFDIDLDSMYDQASNNFHNHC